MPESEPIDVDLHGDPACIWSQVAVRWLWAVAERRPVRVRLRPLSVALRDGGPAGSDLVRRRRHASVGVCRVLDRLHAAQPDAVDGFWAAVVAQDRGDCFGDLTAALCAAGADPVLAAAAGDDSVDVSLRASMASVERLVGGPPMVPCLVLDGTVAFNGPLLRAAPGPQEGARLWDGILALARTPGFYEVSRPRPAHPAHPMLPPTPEPPALALDLQVGLNP